MAKTDSAYVYFKLFFLNIYFEAANNEFLSLLHISFFKTSYMSIVIQGHSADKPSTFVYIQINLGIQKIAQEL